MMSEFGTWIGLGVDSFVACFTVRALGVQPPGDGRVRAERQFTEGGLASI